jgi:hypothetical protein
MQSQANPRKKRISEPKFRSHNKDNIDKVTRS